RVERVKVPARRHHDRRQVRRHAGVQRVADVGQAHPGKGALLRRREHRQRPRGYASGETTRRRRHVPAAEEVLRHAAVDVRQPREFRWFAGPAETSSLAERLRMVHARGRRPLRARRPTGGVPALPRLQQGAPHRAGGARQQRRVRPAGARPEGQLLHGRPGCGALEGGTPFGGAPLAVLSHGADDHARRRGDRTLCAEACRNSVYMELRNANFVPQQPNRTERLHRRKHQRTPPRHYAASDQATGSYAQRAPPRSIPQAGGVARKTDHTSKGPAGRTTRHTQPN
ncbi:hypothetical protein AAVH_39095, partial [Aphelenchoides avenae]